MRTCPFCGFDEGWTQDLREKHSDPPSFRIKCNVCGAMGPVSKTIEGADRKWDGYLKTIDPVDDKEAFNKALDEDANDILKGKTDLKKEWEELNVQNFLKFVEVLNDGLTNWAPSVDMENLVVKVRDTWSDEGDEGDFECETNVTFDFKNGTINQEGYCECPEIEVPGPGYMVPWDYSQSQEETFDPKKYTTPEEFEQLYTDFVENYGSNFSYFAQQEAESAADTEYCEECGSELEDGECLYCEGEEDLDENVGAPMGTLGNTPGMGNAQPATQAAMTGSQQTSPDAIGSGDKWGGETKKKKKKRVYKKKKKKANEGASINPYDEIGKMMAKRMKVPLYFEKGKDQSVKHVKQKDVENMKPTSGKYTYKVASYDDFANQVKDKKKKKDESLEEAFKISGVSYDVHDIGKFSGDRVYAGDEGILGQNNIFIPWDFVRKLMKKYTSF